jgi:hypothetical protein
MQLGRYFSIQMNSKMNLDKIIVNNSHTGILIEGDLGDLLDISVLEDKLLEAQFSHGVLRVEISFPDLNHLIRNGVLNSVTKGELK